VSFQTSQEQKLERAAQMVERFLRRFQPSYRMLAYHAALPLVLTPELVNYLRVEFLRGEVPWVAEVDLLLSDLCRQVGYELYAMETDVRSYLLKEMKRELGEERMQEVAKRLIRYVRYLHQTNPYISSQELQAQQWAAMVYLEEPRQQAVKEIAEAFQQGLVNQAELARLARITQELAPQLSAYHNLVDYAALVSRVLTDSTKVKSEELERTSEVLAGVELRLPTELLLDNSNVQTSVSASPDVVNLTPELKVFEFEVVTVNNQGQIIQREQRQARYFTEDLGNGVTLEMVAILGGTFTMGAPENEEGSRDSERPQHQVTIKPFFMGEYPVTQAQWQAVAALPQVNSFLSPNPSRFKRADRPVEQVSWYDAVEFCARLSKHTGREYRLPSEAQWEYACRAGTTTPFHYGETITTDLANYDGNRTYGNSIKGKYREETTVVGGFPANAFGLYDMHGNVWEWCTDSWHENYEGAPRDGSAWLENNNDNQIRLVRGGSWYYYPVHCRSACRYNRLLGDRRHDNIGFRVACAAM